MSFNGIDVTKELPACCDRHDFKQGNGSWGSTSTEYYTCVHCGAEHAHFADKRFKVVVIDRVPGPRKTLYRDNERINNFCEDVLMPFFRAKAEGLPPLPEDKWTPRVWSPTPIPRVPENLTVAVQREHGDPKVDGLLNAMFPNRWSLFTSKDSEKVEMPTDPVRKAKVEFWEGVFKEVGLTGYDMIPNQYWPEAYRDLRNTDPWYTATKDGAKLTIGRRKRVYSIEAERKEPFDCKHLHAVAFVDGVTYEDNTRGEWSNGNLMATKVLVHSYGREKLVEYLRLLLRGLQGPV